MGWYSNMRWFRTLPTALCLLAIAATFTPELPPG